MVAHRATIADDFMTEMSANKPFNVDEIALLVEKALETTHLRRECGRCAPRRRGPTV
jgi:hypothetical protein